MDAVEAVARACRYCGPGIRTGLPGNACENCMNTGTEDADEAVLRLRTLWLDSLPISDCGDRTEWDDYDEHQQRTLWGFFDAVAREQQAALSAARPFVAAECAAVLRGDGGVIPVLSAFAGLVSGNNQPCMSGDPRDRLREHDRRRFDATMDAVAETMAAIVDHRTAIKETIR
jgi:hypothetical protein